MASRLFFCAVLVLLTTILTAYTDLDSLAGDSDPDEEIRAIWVTRWDYHSKEDIKRIVAKAASYHFNTIFFQVRGNATVWYPSEFEPWAEELDGRHPGWNPLQEAIHQAKVNKIKLHAWINVFPGWRGVDPPADQSQVLNVHPEWFMVDQEQKPMPLNPHYLWLNPTLPGVMKHLSNVVMELAEVPGLEGIHFDYFRYPGPGFSFDDKSIDLFHDRFGSAAPENTNLWDRFRRDAITEWLREINKSIRSKKPNFILSSAVIGDYDLGPRVFMQDSHQWLSEGIIDYLVPMTYTSDMNMFKRWLRRHQVHLKYKRIIPGLMANPENEVLPDQIRMVRDLRYNGFSIFAYRSLFPDHRSENTISDAIEPLLSRKARGSMKPVRSGGFYIADVKWYPENPVSGDSIRVIGKIERVEDQNDLQVVSVWFKKKDGSGARRLELKKSGTNGAYWYSKGHIPPQTAGEKLYLRLFAYPEGRHTEAVFSDLYQVIVDFPDDHYRSAGEFGPLLSHVVRAALDSQGRIWTLVSGEVRIIEPDGKESQFSPLSPFDEAGSSNQLLGIAAQNDSNMAILAGYNERPWLFVGNVDKPQLNPKYELPKPGLDIAIAGNEMLFILTNESWFVTTDTGRFVGQIRFDDFHTVNNIAVTRNGRDVYVACRSEGTVHHWFGYINQDKLHYTPMADLNVHHMSLGGVSLAEDGLIFMAEAAAGLVRIMDSDFKLVDLLLRGEPYLRAPRLVLPTPESNILYVLETGGTTPVRMHKWVSVALPSH